MYKFSLSLLFSFILLASQTARSQTDSIVLKDLDWDQNAHAGTTRTPCVSIPPISYCSAIAWAASSL